MASFTDLQTKADELIRKGLEGSVWVKRYDAGDTEIEAIMDVDGIVVPDDYTDVGHLTKDQGAAWSREVDTNDTESLGRAEPTRRDVMSDVSGLQFVMQESKAQVLELYEGIDLSSVVAATAGTTHSTFSYDKPARPANLFYRAFVMFKDGEGADAFYFAKWLPRCQATDRGEQNWNEENELQYDVTMTAFVDKDYGTAVRSFWAVPTAMLEAMGITPAE